MGLRHQETDGEVRYLWNGDPILLVTTTARRLVLLRISALVFRRAGDDYLIVASTGGAPQHPTWDGNLTAHPTAESQLGAEQLPVLTRTANEETPRLWQFMTEVWSNSDAYQARTERLIPAVVLTPTG